MNATLALAPTAAAHANAVAQTLTLVLGAAGVVAIVASFVGARPAWAVRCAGLVAVFVTLGYHARVAGVLTAADGPVTHYLAQHRGPLVRQAVLLVTQAGSPAMIVAVAFVAAAVLWWRDRRPWRALIVVATVAVASTIETVTKHVVGRQRPPDVLHEVVEHDLSFPSGHVTGTVALVGVLALVVCAHRGRSARLVGALVVVAAGAVVGFSRLYLGVHWLTDVVGGAVLAAAVLCVAGAALPHDPFRTTRTSGPTAASAHPDQGSARIGSSTAPAGPHPA